MKEYYEKYNEYVDVKEQISIMHNLFLAFQDDKNSTNNETSLSPEKTLEILEEDLRINISCLEQAVKIFSEKHNIDESEFVKNVNGNEELTKEYTDLYSSILLKEEEKMSKKYKIKQTELQNAVLKYQDNLNFVNNVLDITKRRKIAYINIYIIVLLNMVLVINLFYNINKYTYFLFISSFICLINTCGIVSPNTFFTNSDFCNISIHSGNEAGNTSIPFL